MSCGGIGDALARALATVGLTEDRVRRWLGDCGCRERQERLNQLGWWAQRILRGKLVGAKEYLSAIMGDRGAHQ